MTEMTKLERLIHAAIAVTKNGKPHELGGVEISREHFFNLSTALEAYALETGDEDLIAVVL